MLITVATCASWRKLRDFALNENSRLEADNKGDKVSV